MYELNDPVKDASRLLEWFCPDDARLNADIKAYYCPEVKFVSPLKWIVGIGPDPVCTFGAIWVMKKTNKQWPNEKIHFYSISYPQFTGELGKTWEECLPKTNVGSLLSEVHYDTYLTFNGSDLENAVSQAVNIVKGQLEVAGEPKAKVLFVVTYRDAAYVWLMLEKLRKEISFEFTPLLFISDKNNRYNRFPYLGLNQYNGMELANNLPWLTSAARFAKALLEYTEEGDVLFLKDRDKVEVTRDLIKKAKKLLKKYPLANEKWSIKSSYHSWLIQRNCKRFKKEMEEAWIEVMSRWIYDLDNMYLG